MLFIRVRPASGSPGTPGHAPILDSILKIKEIVVVEGKDDEHAVKRAVDAEVIITSGFGIREETFRRIEFARQQKGVIIFTDPDFAGEQIRSRINRRIAGCKQAYLSKEEALNKNDVGIENAAPASILNALERAKCIRVTTSAPEFTTADLRQNGLQGSQLSPKRREKLGRLLRIGYANGKQILNRLNNFGISRAAFTAAVKSLDKDPDLRA